MVAFFHRRTSVRMVSGSWIADIQGDLPGAGTGGRSVDPNRSTPAGSQGPPLKLRPQLYETSFLGMGIMAGRDLQAFLHATRSPKSFPTPVGGSVSTPSTWPPIGRGCSWSPDGLDFLRRNPSCEGWVYTATLQGRYDRTDRPLETEYRHPGTERRLAALTRVATARGLQPGQVVLAWLASGNPSLTPIVGVSSVEQVEHAVEGASTILTEDELTALDTA